MCTILLLQAGLEGAEFKMSGSTVCVLIGRLCVD